MNITEKCLIKLNKTDDLNLLKDVDYLYQILIQVIYELPKEELLLAINLDEDLNIYTEVCGETYIYSEKDETFYKVAKAFDLYDYYLKNKYDELMTDFINALIEGIILLLAINNNDFRDAYTLELAIEDYEKMVQGVDTI